jgi:hypothetical protein
MQMPAVHWELLDEQKRDLAILIDQRREHYEEDDSVNESLIGILNLLDAMQNVAIAAGAWERPAALPDNG